MTTATVGSRYQIIIPREEREKIGLIPHEVVSIEAREGCVVIGPIHRSHWRGIGKEIRGRKDAADYVRALRSEWSGCK